VRTNPFAVADLSSLMTDNSSPSAKALDAARDGLKQVVTIDAALLTFGIAFVQNITKGRGSIGFIDATIVALLVSIAAGLASLISTVGQTHKSGDINDFWVRWPAFICLLSFVFALAFIGWYVFDSPIPISH
jgi:drug/metabolite transporter (DMT)-like permease